MATNIFTVFSPSGRTFSLDRTATELIYKITTAAGKIIPHVYRHDQADECRDVMRFDLEQEHCRLMQGAAAA